MATEFIDPDDYDPDEHELDAIICVPVEWVSRRPEDALDGRCNRCDRAILYSPRSPTNVQRWCIPCATEEMEKEEKGVN